MQNSSTTVIFVCSTCRQGEEPSEPKEGRSGTKFLTAVQNAASGFTNIEVREVECLSNCRNGCNIAVSSQGKWTYQFGNLDAATQAQDVIEIARMHSDTTDGVIPWGPRPDPIKRKTVARIPPL